MGHLTLIAEDVINALSQYPQDLVSQLYHYAPQPEWDNYVSGRFRETKDKDTSQLGGGKPNVATAGRAAEGEASVALSRSSSAGSLKFDEGDSSTAKAGTLDRSIGSSPAARPAQNVLFAEANEGEEDDSRRSALGPTSEEVRACMSLASVSFSNSYSSDSTQFANYLSEQMSGSSNGRFTSPGSSDASDDDDDDVKWFDESSGFPVTNGSGSKSAVSNTTPEPSTGFDVSLGS